MNDDELIAKLRAIVSRRRKYAGFYDWPDKAEKEFGILETFMEALVVQYPHLRLTDASLSEPGEDPPDVWAESVMDGRIGVEITELVDGELAGVQERTPDMLWRGWTAAEFREKLDEIIRRKDSAKLKDPSAQYDGYWLLVHTAEPALSPDDVRSHVKDFAVGPCKLITRCFVLLSYQPGPQPRPATAPPRYPVIEVMVTT